MIRRIPNVLFAVLLSTAAVVTGGCAHPLDRDIEQMLREQLLSNNRAYLEAVQGSDTIQITRPPSEVEKELSDRLSQLNNDSGMQANEQEEMELGADLTGGDQIKGVAMSLERAIKLTVQNNLTLNLARLIPAVRQAQITQAEAIFDAIYFAQFDFTKLDTPQPPTQAFLSQFGSVQQDTRSFTTGIRKTLTTGGQASVSTTLSRNFRSPSFFNVRTFYDADVLVSLQQPLLRNFGSDVTRSQIMLTENARDQGLADLKQSLLNTLADTEQFYWELVFARHRLLFEQRLSRKSRKALEQVVARRIYDASAAQINQMRAFVAQRQLRVLQAQQDVRLASDRLKAVIYTQDLSVAGEDQIIPLDTMVKVSLKYNLLDALTTALQKRPDVQQALSQISDATIRQRVADNQRLPLLDLTTSVTFGGISTSQETESYENLGDGDFIDYLLSLQFEMPIGNRAAEAGFKQRKLERRGAVINYRRAAQNAMFEVKAALRQLETSFKAISAARDARIASADTVRVLEAQVEFGQELTPQFIQLMIDRREILTRDEISEVRALVTYNVAIARYYQAIGTLLERNGIEIDEQGRD